MNLLEKVTKALDDEDQELTPEQLMDFMKEKAESGNPVYQHILRHMGKMPRLDEEQLEREILEHHFNLYFDLLIGLRQPGEEVKTFKMDALDEAYARAEAGTGWSKELLDLI